MRRWLTTGMVLTTMPFIAAPIRAVQGVALTAGLVIDTTTRIRPGHYRLPSRSLDKPALVIRGHDVAVDLTDVVIEGADPEANPDTFTGTGVLIDASDHVTITGGS